MIPRILLVEDNEKNRLLVHDVLSFFGYEVSEAVNGEEAVQKAREMLPDIVLMDIQMPVMDGIAAMKLLREDEETAGLNIIALTSFAMKHDREKLLEVGFDDYLAKPINIRELPHFVKRHLGLERRCMLTAGESRNDDVGKDTCC